MTMVESSMVDAQEIVEGMARNLGGVAPDYILKERADGVYLLIEVAEPNERFYRALDEAQTIASSENCFKGRCAISRRKKRPADVLTIPETQLLQKTISESLTIGKNSYGKDFFDRYTPSVAGLEAQIVASANFVVYGRRGAGKSSLLAFAMHTNRRESLPYSWVAMQTYSGRDDDQAIAAVMADIIDELSLSSINRGKLDSIASELRQIGESDDAKTFLRLQRMAPRLKTIFGQHATVERPLTIFLDDLHVVGYELQPKILGFLYSIARANNIFIKISGVEQFSNVWDSRGRVGMEPPHDIQQLKLDHNLTMPEKSREHILNILNAHAKYCGLPSVFYVTGDPAISRLVLAAAAVPRDSLNLFSVAINKAILRSQKSLTLTSINAAVSDLAGGKLSNVEQDTTEDLGAVRQMLERVKDFCINVERLNSFLVPIKSGHAEFIQMQKLAALRLVHVLHEGITPHEAGERYMAFMLDYGFYVGIRAAKSVELFPPHPLPLLAKDLRALPIFPLGDVPKKRRKRLRSKTVAV